MAHRQASQAQHHRQEPQAHPQEEAVSPHHTGPLQPGPPSVYPRAGLCAENGVLEDRRPRQVGVSLGHTGIIQSLGEGRPRTPQARSQTETPPRVLTQQTGCWGASGPRSCRALSSCRAGTGTHPRPGALPRPPSARASGQARHLESPVPAADHHPGARPPWHARKLSLAGFSVSPFSVSFV